MTVRNRMTLQKRRYKMPCHAELVSASKCTFYFPLLPNNMERKPILLRSRIKFGMTDPKITAIRKTRHAEFISASNVAFQIGVFAAKIKKPGTSKMPGVPVYFTSIILRV